MHSGSSVFSGAAACQTARRVSVEYTSGEVKPQNQAPNRFGLKFMRIIDLRSDTVTKPTPGMRQAIANAEVGDDMSGEDPTMNRLEARMAELLGKEAAVYACSGTQSNQMGLRVHCQPGDELLIDETGHLANYEAGGPAALSGISVRFVKGNGGLIDVPLLEGKVRPDDQHYAATRLVCVENTTNLGGGRAYSLAQMERLANWSRGMGLKVHADGARLFNAANAQGYSVGQFAALTDTISVCFSKGLGCPMGAILAGTKEAIRHARRSRKQFGGALRQSGMMAAAALYALDHHVERLAEDHAAASEFARGVAQLPGVSLDLSIVETNLVFFEIDPAWGTAAQFVRELGLRGVRMLALGAQRVRAVTHLDVTTEDVRLAVKEVARVLATSPQGLSEPSTTVAAGPYAAGPQPTHSVPQTKN